MDIQAAAVLRGAAMALAEAERKRESARLVRNEMVRECKAAGQTNAAIAQALGCSPGRVSQILKQAA